VSLYQILLFYLFLNFSSKLQGHLAQARSAGPTAMALDNKHVVSALRSLRIAVLSAVIGLGIVVSPVLYQTVHHYLDLSAVDADAVPETNPTATILLGRVVFFQNLIPLYMCWPDPATWQRWWRMRQAKSATPSGAASGGAPAAVVVVETPRGQLSRGFADVVPLPPPPHPAAPAPSLAPPQRSAAAAAALLLAATSGTLFSHPYRFVDQLDDLFCFCFYNGYRVRPRPPYAFGLLFS
jgi:hypothetical protein